MCGRLIITVNKKGRGCISLVLLFFRASINRACARCASINYIASYYIFFDRQARVVKLELLNLFIIVFRQLHIFKKKNLNMFFLFIFFALAF